MHDLASHVALFRWYWTARHQGSATWRRLQRSIIRVAVGDLRRLLQRPRKRNGKT